MTTSIRVGKPLIPNPSPTRYAEEKGEMRRYELLPIIICMVVY
ncbi:MAG: hypothetical protein U0694_02830 [Anaerolineae bacterium]